MVPYSAPTGVLLSGYLVHRATISRARGPLFLSESRRNRAAPLSLWTWSKVVRRLALAAELPQFSTHTTRHLCLTDLARMGWELHAIATFAGHRSTDSTLAYIHLSGRDLADKLSRGMEQIHGWRVRTIAGVVQLTERPLGLDRVHGLICRVVPRSGRRSRRPRRARPTRCRAGSMYLPTLRSTCPSGVLRHRVTRKHV